jgi:hypothetical protein
MSRNYPSYSQYLGAQRCCDLRGQGPPGPQGPAGPAAIGPKGDTGSIGYTGPTGRGCRGPTGPEGSKTFVIDHPNDNTKYLVHGCLEGPESGVYYRGKGEIINDVSTTIELPDYVKNLATDFTIQVTPIYSGKKMEQLYTSEIENNSFQVYGENCKFYWFVQGKRLNIEVEPLKSVTNVKGSGPYTWI